MTTVAGVQGNTGIAPALRWATCLVVVLGLHAGAVALVLRRVAAPQPPPLVMPEAVLLDLAPEPTPLASPPTLPAPELPAEPAAEAPAPAPALEPSAMVEAPSPASPPPDPQPLPPVPEPAVVLLPPRLPSPVPKRPAPVRLARQTPPPVRNSASVNTQAAPPASNAAPLPPAPTATAPAAVPSNAVLGWRGQLVGQLQRAKRYPGAARAREEQGTAHATFTMDRRGQVLSASLARSSGSQALDEEALALIRRAEPLPPMPGELPGSTITLTVPISFSLR